MKPIVGYFAAVFGSVAGSVLFQTFFYNVAVAYIYCPAVISNLAAVIYWNHYVNDSTNGYEDISFLAYIGVCLIIGAVIGVVSVLLIAYAGNAGWLNDARAYAIIKLLTNWVAVS